MDDNHRYRPYNRNDRRYDDDRNWKYPYKKSNKYPSRYSSYPERRNANDASYRRSYKNDYHPRHHHHHQQQQPMRSRTYSYFPSTTPQPLMSTTVLPPVSAQPPPALSTPLLPVGPQERESWIRSVKKTNTNESTEQKTQYLETMLRMSQQKSLLKSSRFDRMRFADEELVNNTTHQSTMTNNENFDEHDSFHLIDDVNNHEEIRAIERIFFDNDLQVQEKTTDNHQSPRLETQQSRSGFLIDDCDDEEELPPYSPIPPLQPLSEDLISQNEEVLSEGRVALVSELDAADAEQRQELKRQKRLHRKLQKKKRNSKSERSTTITRTDSTENDWIFTNDLDQVDQLSEEVRQASIAMSHEDRTEKVNFILSKIKKQQEELKKLKQYVLSMIGEQPTRTSSSSQSHRSISHRTDEFLLTLVNQSNQSNCWLCSGKMYAEMATQCDDDEQ